MGWYLLGCPKTAVATLLVILLLGALQSASALEAGKAGDFTIGSASEVVDRIGGEEDDREFADDSLDGAALPAAFSKRKSTHPASPLQQKPGAHSQHETVPPLNERWTWLVGLLRQSYALHVVTALLILAVCFNMWRGQSSNYLIATTWFESILDILKDNFATVGFEKSQLMIKSYSDYEIYCSGRQNCHYMHGTLELQRRQCFWRYYLLGAFSSGIDTATIDFLLPAQGECSILAICRRKDQRDLLADCWDLCEFGKARNSISTLKSEGIIDGFAFISDTQEVLDALINNAILKTIAASCPYFRLVYLSDLCTTMHESTNATNSFLLGSAGGGAKTPKRVLRISFFVPTIDKMDMIKPLLRMALHLVDAAAQLQLSDRARESIKKMRMSYEKEQSKERGEFRQEQVERKRIEKKRQEDEMLEKMSEQQRRKYEEAQYRKQLKSQRSKIKMIKA